MDRFSNQNHPSAVTCASQALKRVLLSFPALC
jgi:hypothetical protein